MQNFQIEIGDNVELDQIEGLDEFGNPYNLFGTALDLDYSKRLIKVVFPLYTTEDPSFLGDGSEFEWFSFDKVLNIFREYKVMSVSDNEDTKTGETLIIVELSRIIKLYKKVEDGYQVETLFRYNNLDTFILEEGSDAYNHICIDPEENKFLCLSNFRVGHSYKDGVTQTTYYDKPNEEYI